jgi:hypothetical protein
MPVLATFPEFFAKTVREKDIKYQKRKNTVYGDVKLKRERFK